MNERRYQAMLALVMVIVLGVVGLIVFDIFFSSGVTVSGYRWERTYRIEQYIQVPDYVLRGDAIPDDATDVENVRGEVRRELTPAEQAQGNCVDMLPDDLTISVYECDITQFLTYEWQIIAPLRITQEDRAIDDYTPEINTCAEDALEPNCQRVFDFTSSRFWLFFEDSGGDVHDCRVDEAIWRETEIGRSFDTADFFDDELVCETLGLS